MSNILDTILGAIGMGGNNNQTLPIPPNNSSIVPNRPSMQSGSGLVNQMAMPNNPVPKPRFSNIPMPVSKPFYEAPPMTLGDRFKNTGTGLLNNLSTFVNPQDQQQRMANLRFASKLAQLSRPQVGVTNKRIGATIGNIGESLEAYSEGMSPQIFQLGDRLVQLNADGTTTVLDEGSPEEVEAPELSSKASVREENDIDAILVSTNLKNQAQKFINLIDNKKLVFFLGKPFVDNFNLALKTGDQELAINSQRFATFIQKLTNESLRLNKGVQTEGDAQRAIKELQTTVETNNTQAIRSSLQAMMQNCQVEISKRTTLINIRRKNANVPAFDFDQLSMQSSTFADDVASTSLGSLSAEDQLSQLGL